MAALACRCVAYRGGLELGNLVDGNLKVRASRIGSYDIGKKMKFGGGECGRDSCGRHNFVLLYLILLQEGLRRRV